MRCRKGDMAYDLGYNHAYPYHYGRICHVIEFLGETYADDGVFCKEAWGIRYIGESENEEYIWIEDDSKLLPIRPGDLDETQETEKEFTA